MIYNCISYYPNGAGEKAQKTWLAMDSSVGEEPSDCLWLFPLWEFFASAS